MSPDPRASPASRRAPTRARACSFALLALLALLVLAFLLVPASVVPAVPGIAFGQEPPRGGVFLRDGITLTELKPIELPAIAYSVSALAGGEQRASLVQPQQVRFFSLNLKPSFVLSFPAPPAAVELYAAEGRTAPQAKIYPLGTKGTIELIPQHDLSPGRIYVLLVSVAEGDTRYYAVGVGAKDADDFFYRKVFLDSMAPTAELRALMKLRWLGWFRVNFPASRHTQEANAILESINRDSACEGGREFAIEAVEENLRREAKALRGSMLFRLSVQGKVLAADVEGKVEKILNLDFPNPLSPEKRLFTADAASAAPCQIALGVDPGGTLSLTQKPCEACPIAQTLVEFSWQPSERLVAHSVTGPSARASEAGAAPRKRSHRWTLDEPCTLVGREIPPDDYDISVADNLAIFRAVERRGSFEVPCIWRSLSSAAAASRTDVDKGVSCQIRSITPTGARYKLIFREEPR